MAADAGVRQCVPRAGRACHAVLVKYYFDCGSSNGRTAGFGPADGGSNPPPRAVTRCRWTNWSGRLSVKEECTGSSPVRHPLFALWIRSLTGKAPPCDGGEWQFESARVHQLTARLRRLTEGQRSSEPLMEVRIFPEPPTHRPGRPKPPLHRVAYHLKSGRVRTCSRAPCHRLLPVFPPPAAFVKPA